MPDLSSARPSSGATPCTRASGKIAYISATDAYVNLGFFNGAALADPTGKIEGTGKSMRHVKIRSLEDLDADQVSRLGHPGGAIGCCRPQVGCFTRMELRLLMGVSKGGHRPRRLS